jgi:DNA-binding LytR/AlgR family response regulator
MDILIVEDDALIAEHLKEIIGDEGKDNLQIAFSGKEAIRMMQEKTYDLLLLDINMESAVVGIEVASYVNEHFQTPFIFITAQSDKQIVNRAVSMQPSAFIIKPFSPVAVIAAIEIVRQSISNDKLTIRDAYKDIVIPMKSILYGKASNNYVEIYSSKKRWVVRSTLLSLLEQLPQDKFIQVHRSYFVNKGFVESVTASKIAINGEVIPISKGFEIQVKTFIGE